MLIHSINYSMNPIRLLSTSSSSSLYYLQIYLTPIREERILTEEEISVVFSSAFESIVGVATELLKNLEQNAENWDNKTSLIGEVFTKWVTITITLTLYTVYLYVLSIREPNHCKRMSWLIMMD